MKADNMHCGMVDGGEAMVRIYAQSLGADKVVLDSEALQRLIDTARKVEEVELIEVGGDIPTGVRPTSRVGMKSATSSKQTTSSSNTTSRYRPRPIRPLPRSSFRYSLSTA